MPQPAPFKLRLLLVPVVLGLGACAAKPGPEPDTVLAPRWVDEADPTPGHYDLLYMHEGQRALKAARRGARQGHLNLRLISAHPRQNPQPPVAASVAVLGPALNLRLSQNLGRAARQPAGTTPHLPESKRLRVDAGWAPGKPALSPGDRVLLSVQNGEEFSGLFEIDLDGSLNLPFLPAIYVAGDNLYSARNRIENALIHAGFFRRDFVSLSLQVQQWAPIQVHVSGAVFQPGIATVNVRKPDERAQKSLQQSGDFPPDRFLPAALRAAGGVRPDADLGRVMIIRGQGRYLVDLSGIPAGMPGQPQVLMAGDQVIVPSTGRFNEALVRPSAVTPPGIRVFMSNLTVPATDNSKAAIGNQSTSLPYGTRFLSGLISANCVGGTQTTNAARVGLLVSRDPISGETEIFEKPIEKIIAEPERESLNPHLMPNDGIACYDSGITNLRDIGRTIADMLLPFRN